jgi:hypothetical protein
MAKFTKEFTGCKAGEIYPTTFAAGDDCPPELEDAARECGVLAETAEPKPRAKK